MKTVMSRAALTALALWGLAACGRSDLQRVCTDDSECRNGRVCFQGECTDNVPEDDGGIDTDGGGIDEDTGPPPDVGPPPPDIGPPPACEVDSDCPGGGVDGAEVGEQCFLYVCGDGGVCELADEVAVDCPDFEVQDGCGCGPIECEEQPECGEYGCDQRAGECRPCVRDDDCGELSCDESTGLCGPCQSDLDCTAAEVCDVRQGECEPRPQCVIDSDCGEDEVCLSGRCSFSPECSDDADCREGFECVDGNCFEEICRGPEDCAPGELCDAGACVPPPRRIDRCFVATPDRTVSPGQRVQLEAFAVDDQGDGIAAAFVWDTSDPAIVSIAGTFAEAGSTAGTALVTATAQLDGSTVLCDGQVALDNVGPAPMNGTLRVVVSDAETGGAVVGATVVVDGTVVLSAAGGVASFMRPNGDFDVSVFTDDYDYVTVLDVDAPDIVIPLTPRTGAGPIGGFTGSFDNSALSSTGEVALGLAGGSISGGLLNFDLGRLLGDPFVTPIQIPTQGNADIPLPGGLTIDGRFLGFRLNFKTTYYATVSAGARLAWGLAGRIPVADLINIVQNQQIDGFGDALAIFLPLFNRFDHGFRPLQVTASQRVIDSVDFDNDGDTSERLPDYANFPSETIRPSVRQQLITQIDVSNLPFMTNGQAEAAVLLGGTLLQAPGFVPLGISATTDDDGDGRPDVRRLTMAPPYGSLVGSRYSVLAIAFLAQDVGGSQQTGVELPDELSVALWNGQQLPTAIQMGTFPNTAQVVYSEPARQFSLTAQAGPLYRARMVGLDRSWDVWSRGPSGVNGTFTHTFTVPAAPMGFEDLVTSYEKITLDAVRTQVAIEGLLSANGVGLTDTALVSTGFSRTLVRD